MRPNKKDVSTAARGVSLEHRHFAFIASAIAGLASEGTMSAEDAAAVAEHFAGRCAGTNPRFDRSRFLAACCAEAEGRSDG